MGDNRFAIMCVNRSGQTSRRTNGYETVQARLQETGRTASARDADVGTRSSASGSCTFVRGQSANGIALGADGGRRPPSMATATVRAARSDEHSRANQAQQDVGSWRVGQRLSDRAVDLGADR